MCDNCGSMIRTGKISSVFSKIFCASHKIAKIDDLVHKNSSNLTLLDQQLTKLHAFFNYRHAKFNLKAKPPTSTSTTRPWRSHMLIYNVAIKNFNIYEELKKDIPDFPQLPEKINLLRAQQYQQSIADIFDELENKEANLITQVSAFVTLSILANNSNTRSLIGTSLSEIISLQKTKDVFFSKDSLAFCLLSRVSFDAICSNIDESRDTLKSKAIAYIKELSTMFSYENKANDSLIPKSKVSKMTSLLFSPTREQKSPQNSIGSELREFELMESTLTQKDFWLHEGSKMPTLRSIYRLLASIPAGNSSIERAFSTSKLVFDDLKNRTSMESIEAQMILALKRK